jgi:hypothetical protein
MAVTSHAKGRFEHANRDSVLAALIGNAQMRGSIRWWAGNSAASAQW